MKEQEDWWGNASRPNMSCATICGVAPFLGIAPSLKSSVEMCFHFVGHVLYLAFPSDDVQRVESGGEHRRGGEHRKQMIGRHRGGHFPHKKAQPQ